MMVRTSFHPRLLTQIAVLLLASIAFISAISFVQEIIIYLKGGIEHANRIERLSVDREGSLCAWFSATLMAACALVLFVYGMCDPDLSRWSQLRWKALAVVFLFVSLDETIQIHEFGNRLRHVLHTSGMLHFAWVIPAAVIVAIGLLAYIPFIREFRGRARFFLVLSVVFYLGGAMGLEMLAGILITNTGKGTEQLSYQALAHIEETLEMLGLTTFLLTLLSHVSERLGGISLSFGPRVAEGLFTPPVSAGAGNLPAE